MTPSRSSSIGVVVPVHGSYVRVIGRTLDAIKNQSVTPRAVIVVVDGPDAKLEDMVQGHSLDCEVLVMPTNSGGPSTPRNEGAARLLEKHDLDGIWFLDADDVPHPRFIEIVSNAMDLNPEVDLVCTEFRVWEGGGDLPVIPDLDPGEVAGKNIDLDWYLNRTGDILPSFTVVHPRVFSHLRESGTPFDPSYRNNQDYDMFVRLLHVSKGIRLAFQGGVYRVHPEGISAQGARAWLCRTAVDRDLERWFQDRGANEQAHRWRTYEGSSLRKASRHLWRRNRFGDRSTAISLLTENVLEHRSVRSLLLLLLMPMGLDPRSRRIPQTGDTRSIEDRGSGP